ncbi:MAG: NAD(P)/FAD-dependent oxidoreductase [Luteolibacter sp.]|uniref:NAD(P)/FAD-dependent oxidoreductase n=1 Tax=Luteolibacter sp. TaxID=1962973 RepID=UPI0032679FCB
MSTKVLILGAGFGGLAAAIEFDKAMASRPDLEVTLIDKENHFLFTPMLHEVAAGELEPTSIVNPIRKMLKRVKFYSCDATRIDLEKRQAVVCHGYHYHGHDLSYDHLLLGLGSITSFFGLPGVESQALTMKSLADAVRLRNRMISNLEEAESECSTVDKEPLLTFVVAGGGFAGVETMAGMRDFIHAALPHFPSLSWKQIRLVLVHPGKTILPELGEELGTYAQQKLSERGVEIRSESRVAGFEGGDICLTDGTRIRSHTLVWTAGTTAHPLLGDLPLPKERGRVLVDETFAIAGCPGIWAIGDCAAVPNPDTGGFHPPTAQHASRQGVRAARNILATIDGQKTEPFRFKTLGLLASLGHRAGVAQVMGFKFSGLFAWLMWRGIYWMKLPRMEKKLRILFQWVFNEFFAQDFVQYRLGDGRAEQPQVDPPIKVACE